jgi:hypothetical protein
MHILPFVLDLDVTPRTGQVDVKAYDIHPIGEISSFYYVIVKRQSLYLIEEIIFMSFFLLFISIALPKVFLKKDSFLIIM